MKLAHGATTDIILEVTGTLQREMMKGKMRVTEADTKH